MRQCMQSGKDYKRGYGLRLLGNLYISGALGESFIIIPWNILEWGGKEIWLDKKITNRWLDTKGILELNLLGIISILHPFFYSMDHPLWRCPCMGKKIDVLFYPCIYRMIPKVDHTWTKEKVEVKHMWNLYKWRKESTISVMCLWMYVAVLKWFPLYIVFTYSVCSLMRIHFIRTWT